MAYHLASKLAPGLFAAVVPISGGILKGFFEHPSNATAPSEREFSTSQVSTAVGILDIHGSDDTQVPANATTAGPAGKRWAQSFDGWW